ncbi:MAG: type II secretion system F family protein [Acidimicrobiia bacterium]
MTEPGIALLAGTSAALLLAGIAGTLVPPTPRLGPRVRPYTIVSRAALGRSADVAVEPRPVEAGGTLARLFGPPAAALGRPVSRLIERRSDEYLSRALRHAGRVDTNPDGYRKTVLIQSATLSAAGIVVGVLILRSAVIGLLLVACGLVVGTARNRARLDREIEQRKERIRLELYTVNQLLAMQIRSGAGPVQATQRIVDRGSGGVVQELSDVMLAIRSGASERDAFESAAEATPEPAAARTYKLFATGVERGADLAGALRALSEDLRDARREELRRTATKRRAAMLVPTIAVLAPIMLLFIAAPIPSIVFGSP